MFGDDNPPQKITFKKKKFGARSRVRTLDDADDTDDNATTSFASVKTENLKSQAKKARWAKYSTLQAETAPIVLEKEENDALLGGNNTTSQSVRSDDDEGLPVVVDLMDVDSKVDSVGAYVTVSNNTFSLAESHFRDAVPTLKQEYEDDDVENIENSPQPKDTDIKDDADMYDIEMYAEEKAAFNDDVYAYEILSDASEAATVKIGPVVVSSIKEVIAKLRELAQTHKEEVSSAQQEVETLQAKLQAATAARDRLLAEL